MALDARILLVDDEVRLLETLSMALEDMGCYVRTAPGPDEAMRCAREDTFQIAFVDNFLGPMRGVDLMQQMAKQNPALDFVIMTANPDIDLAVEALKTGASDFIRKPFRIEEMLRSIEYVYRKKALERQRRDLLTGLELKVKEKTEELKHTYLSVLASLSRAVETKDLGTYGHSIRVSDYCRLIAIRLDFDDLGIDNIRAAALLHDIGKIGISDAILGKKGHLSEEEINIVRSHAQKGVEILSPLKQFEALLPAILHHHEHYDGSGYPAGLAGDAIPLSARIIAIADAYDSILSNRPYRSAANQAMAIAELMAHAGRQFDPRLVNDFVQVLRAGHPDE
jgi:putative two-component system response regulator